jgi:hypothetical protein
MAPNKRPRFPAFSRVDKGKEPLVGSCPSSDDDETQDPNAESPYRPAFEENDTLSHSQFEKGFTMPPSTGLVPGMGGCVTTYWVHHRRTHSRAK